MGDLSPLTVAEARAILIADDALALSFAAREECGRTLGIDEFNAWRSLVESAKEQITTYERSGAGGIEAIVSSEQQRKAP